MYYTICDKQFTLIENLRIGSKMVSTIKASLRTMLCFKGRVLTEIYIPKTLRITEQRKVCLFSIDVEKFENKFIRLVKLR